MNKNIFYVDELGLPLGGKTTNIGLNIEWQGSPIKHPRGSGIQKGATVEDVIYAAIERLNFYQRDERFSASGTAAALTHLYGALVRLDDDIQNGRPRL